MLFFCLKGKTPGKNELYYSMFPNMSQSIEKLWELYQNLEKKELASEECLSGRCVFFLTKMIFHDDWVFPMPADSSECL